MRFSVSLWEAGDTSVEGRRALQAPPVKPSESLSQPFLERLWHTVTHEVAVKSVSGLKSTKLCAFNWHLTPFIYLLLSMYLLGVFFQTKKRNFTCKGNNKRCADRRPWVLVYWITLNDRCWEICRNLPCPKSFSLTHWGRGGLHVASSSLHVSWHRCIEMHSAYSLPSKKSQILHH